MGQTQSNHSKKYNVINQSINIQSVQSNSMLFNETDVSRDDFTLKSRQLVDPQLVISNRKERALNMIQQKSSEALKQQNQSMCFQRSGLFNSTAIQSPIVSTHHSRISANQKGIGSIGGFLNRNKN